MADPEEDDILVALGVPPSHKSGAPGKKPPPRRPPPPRSQTLLPQSFDGAASDIVSQSLPPARPHAPPSYKKAISESNLYVPPPWHSTRTKFAGSTKSRASIGSHSTAMTRWRWRTAIDGWTAMQSKARVLVQVLLAAKLWCLATCTR